jgi:hypothetical protein
MVIQISCFSLNNWHLYGLACFHHCSQYHRASVLAGRELLFSQGRGVMLLASASPSASSLIPRVTARLAMRPFMFLPLWCHYSDQKQNMYAYDHDTVRHTTRQWDTEDPCAERQGTWRRHSRDKESTFNLGLIALSPVETIILSYWSNPLWVYNSRPSHFVTGHSLTFGNIFVSA